MTDQETLHRESFTGPSSQLASYEFDFASAIESLHADPAWQGGLSRKTLVHYPDFQITLRALRANTKINEHHNPGRISVQTVAGHIRMHAQGRVFDLPVGHMLVLDRDVPHDVEAVEDSVFLLTVAKPEGTSQKHG